MLLLLMGGEGYGGRGFDGMGGHAPLARGGMVIWIDWVGMWYGMAFGSVFATAPHLG